jgi:adenine C2-methylase RlmN of 23S rRNA A2503 and tRNA A37
MGLLGNLTTSEILEQLVHANNIEPIRNVVFMGMGEPLDNYDNVKTAIAAMIDVRQFSLSANKISVSTVGVLPKVKLLLAEYPQVDLALSLHAPTQALRERIVPTAKSARLLTAGTTTSKTS